MRSPLYKRRNQGYIKWMGAWKVRKRKDLGIMVHKDLTWTSDTNRRCEKELKAFFTIKRNVARRRAWQAKKDLYRCYIVQIISYRSVLWKPNKQDLKKVEPIQMKATKLILSTGQLTYKDRLRRLDILPLSLYHELHVLFFFLDIVSGRYDIEWQNSIQVN